MGAGFGVGAADLQTATLSAYPILALLALPLEAVRLLLPVIGLALNGTSSVLYGSVPVLVGPQRRARAFSVFYTGTIGAGAGAPVVFGAFGDLLGMPTTIALTGLFALLTIPPAVALRPFFRR